MRAITFRNIAPGHWVNTETGVELIRGTLPVNGQLRWTVSIPNLKRADGRQAMTVRDSLAGARRYARLIAVPMVRELIAEAWEDAHALPAAPAVLVFSAISTVDHDGSTRYATPDLRYVIRGRLVAGNMGSATNPDRAFTPYRNGQPVGPSHRRLVDAKQAAQRDWEDLCKAHNSARLCEQARLAGDPGWRDAAVGQQLQALAEDARRTGERDARKGSGPRQLSGWGQLREAHRAAALS